MNDAEFLEMCRLAAAPDTGGQRTDKKIDAIEHAGRLEVERDLLLDQLAAVNACAQAAEAKLALVDEYASYYLTAWDDFAMGQPAPLSFAEWLAARQDEVQP